MGVRWRLKRKTYSSRYAGRCSPETPRCVRADRVVRRKMGKYNVKRATHRDWPTPSLPIGRAVRILSPP